MPLFIYGILSTVPPPVNIVIPIPTPVYGNILQIGGADITNYMFRLKSLTNTMPTTDVSGIYTITNTNGVVIVPDISYGNVFSFSGSNYLSIPATTPTISTRTFWIKTSTPTTSLGYAYCSANYPIYFNGTSNLGFWVGSNTTKASDTNALSSNWSFYAITTSSTGGNLYINNNQSYIATTTTTWTGDASPIYFGTYNAGAGGYYTGYLDDMRQYNYALTPSQLNQIYFSHLYLLDFSNAPVICYYPFDGSFNNLAKSPASTDMTNNLGTNNITFNYTTYKINNASVYFDGTNGTYLSASIPNTKNAFCIAGWFYFPALPGGNRIIFAWHDGTLSSTYYYMMFQSTGNLLSGTQAYNDTVATALSINTWYHLVWIYSRTGTQIMYVNGVQTANNQRTAPTYTIGTFSLGTYANPSGSTPVPNMYVDDVRYYDGVLTPTQVSQLYNFRKP